MLNKNCRVIKTLCVGLISAILLAGCGSGSASSLEDYFAKHESARDGLVQELNGQFVSTGAKSDVVIKDNTVSVEVDITDLAKKQGIEKTNKSVKMMKDSFADSFGGNETLLQKSLSALAEKVDSETVNMVVKIVWEDDTVFSTNIEGKVGTGNEEN